MRRLAFLLVVFSCLACLQACDDGEMIDLDPVRVGGEPPPPAPLPRIAMDFAGNGVAAWNDGASVVACLFDGDTGTWGPDETIATGSGDVERVSVAMHAVGRAIAAWAQGDQIWSLGYDRLGSGWDATSTRVDDGGQVDVSSFTFDPTNVNVFAVWRKVVNFDATTQFAAAFGARHLPGGWRDLRRLDRNPSDPGLRPLSVLGLRVATGGPAMGVAVWQARIDGTGEVASFASSYAGGWGDPQRLAPIPGDPFDPADGQPSVGMDGDGNALAVYVSDGVVRGRRLGRSNQAWGTPSQVDDHPGLAANPCIAVNGDGKALAVWTKVGTGRVHASRYTPGSGWSPSMIIDIDIQGTPTTDFFNPASGLCVGIDAEGRGRALWTANELVWTIEFDGSNWLFADQVGTGNRTDIAVAPNGRAIGVWWNDDGLQRRVWEGPPPPPPLYTGTLVFASDRFSDDFELYTMMVDTAQTTRNTINPAEDTDPVWSPDGSKACFVSNRDAPGFAPDATDLYLWEPGGNPRITRLTFFNVDGGSARDPAWSHNTLEIAFEGRLGNHESIRVVEVATGNVRPVSGGSFDRWPSWSHDNIHIAYSSGGDLLLVDAGDGPSQTPIVILSRANTDESPAFSRDGQTLAFAARGPIAQGIQVIELTTGTLLTRTSTAGDRQPAWSPDGAHIAFVRDGADGARIWIMDSDGQNPLEIPGQLGDNHDPDWKD